MPHPSSWPSLLSDSIYCKGKGKGFPYSLPSVGRGADPGLQAVTPKVTISHPPGGRLPLLFTRLLVTFPAADHHRPSACTKLYCLVTEAHKCENLSRVFTQLLPRLGFEPTTKINDDDLLIASPTLYRVYPLRHRATLIYCRPRFFTLGDATAWGMASMATPQDRPSSVTGRFLASVENCFRTFGASRRNAHDRSILCTESRLNLYVEGCI